MPVSMLIHVLIVKDVEAEAELVATELRRAGFAPEWRRAATEAEYVNHLDPGLDVILGDYRLPSFSAERALHILKERELDVPFIVVSGRIGEDAAVALMKQGAIDVLFTNRLAPLASAVAQALEHKRLRAARRTAEAALRDSEERYRLITETVRDAIFMIDLDGRLIFGNRSGEDLTGYILAEFRGLPIASLLSPEAARESAARLAAVQAGDEVSPWFETEIVRKDGRRVWVEAQVATVLRDGAPVGRIGVVRDITERRRSEESLRLLESAVRHAGESIIITTAELDLPGPQILFVNPAFTRLTGYTVEEVIGRTPRILQGPLTDRAMRRRLREDLAAGHESYGETINYRKDRTPFPISWHITPVRDEQGRVTTFVGIHRDLTEQKRAEEQFAAQRDALYQSEKLGAMGQLIAGVAHDFNNLLTVITGRSQLALRGLPTDHPHWRTFELIEKTAVRAAALTRQLLAFSRQQVLQPRVLDLNAVISGLAPMLQRLIGEDIEFAVVVAPDLGRVKADPSQIEQVIVNLAVNARDAMPQGGRLTIETANADLDEGSARQHVGVHPGRYVLLAVSDTGHGMDAATQARIFEPFFTTKEKGKGTGLGLATVYGFAQQSGGHIGVSSAPGQGAMFTLYLPRVDEAVETEAAGPPAGVGERGSETILLVEDDEEVRAVARETLEAAGYVVLPAANATEALGLTADGSRRIHLLVTDVIMPHVSGRELAERLAPTYPDVRVLYISGYTNDAIVRHGVQAEETAFLQKPFTPGALLRKVREVLDGPR